MRAYSNTPIIAAGQSDGALVQNPSPERAPDLAWTQTDVAGLGGHARLSRLDRPEGLVRVFGAPGLSVAIRINLMAREPATGLGNVTRLKQCVAPDYFVIVAPGKSVVLPAHAAQALVRLDIAAAQIEAIIGAPVSFERIEGQFFADGFIAGLVERLTAGDAQSERLNASLVQTLILALVAANAGARAKQASGGLTARQLALLREHVESRLQEPLRTKDLARLVDLSPFHFARAFKRSMGATPAAWIKLRRLTVAQRLLADPQRSITDVAAAVGYDSPSRFARAFRETTGQSPSSFRRAAARKV